MFPEINSTETLSILNDPFIKEKITGIHIHLHKKSYGEGFHDWAGSMDFINGKTEGTQKFTAKTLDSLIYQMKNFMEIELD